MFDKSAIVSIPVTNQETTKSFYTQILGGRVVEELLFGPGTSGLAISEIKKQSYGQEATFKDPDGNGWVLQQPGSAN